MSKKCKNCGAEIEDNHHFCTECGMMVTEPEKFTYYYRSINNPKYYMGSNAKTINKKYGMLMKNMNMAFAISMGIIVAFIGLVVWITLK